MFVPLILGLALKSTSLLQQNQTIQLRERTYEGARSPALWGAAHLEADVPAVGDVCVREDGGRELAAVHGDALDVGLLGRPRGGDDQGLLRSRKVDGDFVEEGAAIHDCQLGLRWNHAIETYVPTTYSAETGSTG